MRCDEFQRWLNDGADAAEPGRGDAAGRHAATCASCARDLAAARSIERLLASPPPSPASGPDVFVARVLAQIEQTPQIAPVGSPPSTSQVAPVPRPRTRLWWSLFAEPFFVAGAAGLLAVLRLPPIAQGTAQGAGVAVALATRAMAAAFDRLLGPAARALALPPDLHPAASAALLIGVMAPLLWAGVWGVAAVDRWLRRGSGRRS